MSKDIRVVIDEDSPRAADFLQIFGRRDVPVLSTKPVMRLVEGSDRPQPCYMLDLNVISRREWDDLVSHLAGADEPLLEDEIAKALDDHGWPIPTSECYLVVQHPLTWID